MDFYNVYLKIKLFWLFSVLFIVFSFVKIHATTTPPLSVNETEHDFGVISQESTVYVTFRVTNTTNKPVQIEKIHSSCGCTLVKSLKEVIAPRESLPLEVSFDPRDKYGISREQIWITYKNPSYPDLVLAIKSKISSSIVAVPQEIQFEPVSVGNPILPKIIRIIQTDTHRNQSLEVMYAGSTSGLFDVQVNNDPSGNRFEKQVNIIPHKNLPVGIIRDNLLFKTNHPFMKKIEIPVFAEVDGNIKVRPEVLLFGFCQPLKTYTKTIQIINANKNPPIKISKVDTNLSQLKLKLERNASSENSYQLRAELKPGKSDDTISGTIKIRTTDPYQNLIKIPVIANVIQK